jgi:hypothetical protein
MLGLSYEEESPAGHVSRREAQRPINLQIGVRFLFVAQRGGLEQIAVDQ